MREYAELTREARPQITPADERHKGIAKHPLARRWLKRCRQKELRAAVSASTAEERAKHYRRAAGINDALEVEQ